MTIVVDAYSSRTVSQRSHQSGSVRKIHGAEQAEYQSNPRNLNSRKADFSTVTAADAQNGFLQPVVKDIRQIVLIERALESDMM